MSSTLDAGDAGHHSDRKKKCPRSPTGEHKYTVTAGMWPSEEKTCKYCKHRYYTK